MHHLKKIRETYYLSHNQRHHLVGNQTNTNPFEQGIQKFSESEREKATRIIQRLAGNRTKSARIKFG
jgi:hypothetical protein